MFGSLWPQPKQSTTLSIYHSMEHAPSESIPNLWQEKPASGNSFHLRRDRFLLFSNLTLILSHHVVKWWNFQVRSGWDSSLLFIRDGSIFCRYEMAEHGQCLERLAFVQGKYDRANLTFKLVAKYLTQHQTVLSHSLLSMGLVWFRAQLGSAVEPCRTFQVLCHMDVSKWPPSQIEFSNYQSTVLGRSIAQLRDTYVWKRNVRTAY